MWPYPYEDGAAGMELGQLLRGVELVLHADLVGGDGGDLDWLIRPAVVLLPVDGRHWSLVWRHF